LQIGLHHPHIKSTTALPLWVTLVVECLDAPLFLLFSVVDQWL